ncbi:MAG: DUF2993 domain-containing protein [Cyanobacteria bacterium J06642_2]
MNLKKVAAWMLAVGVPTIALATPAMAQFVGTLLNPVVASWIESEVDEVENLKVDIQGSDQQLTSGTIPSASVAGENLLYEGFRITQVQLDGQNIRLNISEAIQGSKLRLLDPVPVQVKLRLTEADLNQSLQSPIIQSQLAQANVELPIGGSSVPFRISDPQVTLLDDTLQIDASVATDDGTSVPVTVATGVRAQNGNELLLVNPAWVSEGQSIPIDGLNDMAIEFGNEVNIDSLLLQEGAILYAGKLTIRPENL